MPIPEERPVPAQRSQYQAQRRLYLAQCLTRAVLYAAPALLCAHAASVSDPDLWWHLRSAEWIVQHHAVPHTDPFSTFGAEKPWAAYSWLYEILVLKLFERLGLVGIVVYSTAMVFAITVALHRLVKRLQPDFTVAALLTFVAALSLWRLDSPRPWHFSILFFILELDVLMHARRTGRIRELLWLPALFALWSNLHIQFIDGLLLLALAAAEPLAATWRPPAISPPTTRLPAFSTPPAASRLSLPAILPIFLACVLTTFLNPYGAHIYVIARDLAAQPGVLDRLAELQAIPFRNVSDYCVLMLALAAAASLARSSCRGLFETAAFAFAVFLSFRSQRDVWLIAAIASAIIASSMASAGITALRKSPFYNWPIIATTAAILLGTGFRLLHIDNSRLQAQIQNGLPISAAAFVRGRGYPGPLYNDYPWGGYLIWALHRPVAIDGRAALYGTSRMDRFAATWNGAPDWHSDPDLDRARLVVGPVKAPLTQLLRSDPRFQLVYEDALAAVFISPRP